MPGTNDILPFALGGAANLMPQGDYATTSSSRVNGFQRGVASSAEVNKVLRQAAFMARVLSQWAVDATGGSILDNGDVTNAENLITLSVQAITNAILAANNYATVPTVNTHVSNLVAIIQSEDALWKQAVAAEAQTRSTADTNEAQTRAAADTAEANTRLAQDQAIIATLAGYMTRGTTNAGFARLISAVTVTGLVRLDMPVDLNVTSRVLVIGTVNVSLGLQPVGAFFTLYIDALQVTTEATIGPMSNTFSVTLAAGAHVATLFYLPSTSAPMNQVGLNLSYIAVEA